MPEKPVSDYLLLSVDSLPPGAAPVARPDAARIHAVGTGDPDSAQAHAILRQRRTAEMLVVISFVCAPCDRAKLAAAVLSFAAASGARLIRAAPDQIAAIEALDLRESGRGYAQRWIGPVIASVHETGQYTQSTGFTCGPVALAMAMGPGVTRSAEIAIWREATTMIGLRGPGGCDPYGMALAAARRGFETTLYCDAEGAVLLDRADTEAKKDLMRFVQSEFRAEAEMSLTVHREQLSIEALTEAVRTGARVILLIDQCHTHDHHAPHWILVHAEHDGIFLVNDPWAEPEDGEGIADVDCIPIAAATLWRMAAYGDPPYHAAVLLR